MRPRTVTDDNIQARTRRRSTSKTEDLTLDILDHPAASPSNIGRRHSHYTRRGPLIHGLEGQSKWDKYISSSQISSKTSRRFVLFSFLIALLMYGFVSFFYIVISSKLGVDYSMWNRIEYSWHACSNPRVFVPKAKQGLIPVHNECIEFTISSGGVGNQRGTIRNGLDLARSESKCLILDNFRCGTPINQLISLPSDTCVTQDWSTCKLVYRYSETCIYLSGHPMTQSALQNKQTKLPPSSFLEHQTHEFLKKYGLFGVDFACIHARLPEPGFIGDMGRHIDPRHFADEFLKVVGALNKSMPILLMSSGYEFELVNEIKSRSNYVVEPTKTTFLHVHGKYDKAETLEASIHMNACSKAKFFLGRQESTFSREIALLSEGQVYHY